jgi:two-component system LytT family response regulator
MKVLLVEDEMMAARRLEKMVLEIFPDWSIAGTTDGILSTRAWLDTHGQPDLVLLDIHLADGSSLTLMEDAAFECPVIFTTAYDQYAVQAFRYHALDYLLKPVKKAELAEALLRASRQAGLPTDQVKALLQTMQPARQEGKRFLIRFAQQLKVVELREVQYFYSQDKVTFLITAAGKRYPIDEPLDALEASLDKNAFFRVNRQCIIRLEAIQEMQAHSKSRLKLVLKPAVDMEVVVSTEKTPVFKQWLQGNTHQ